MAETADVVIAGGAVMGSSIAFHLAEQSDGRLRIVVVEPDPSYHRAASALSAGSIRQQFSTAINIDISLHGITFLRAIGERLAVGDTRPDVGLHEGGYLYLATTDGMALMREINALQRARGADIALLDRNALAERCPYLAPEGIALGSLGLSGEGWFDGYGLMMAFRNKARALGVTYRTGSVTGVASERGAITGISLADGSHIACGTVVNAAGASGARTLSAAMGYPIPVYAKRRSVFAFRCPEALPGFPLLIDTSGVWVRPEGDGFIAGFSPDDLNTEDHAHDFSVDWPLFEEMIWPALAARVPAFERIRPARAWAGHYDLCLLDQNALVGPVPDVAGGYCAAGFSGHGLQQAPAVGRGLAEHILTGRYQTLDLSPLSPDRVRRASPLRERNII